MPLLKAALLLTRCRLLARSPSNLLYFAHQSVRSSAFQTASSRAAVLSSREMASGAAPPAPESLEEVLTHRVDTYNGVLCDADSLPEDAAVFARRLRASLAAWREAGRRGVWLQLPLARSALVPVAVDQGFVFHHAERSHLMLTHWLVEGAECTLPANASHQVGVGAFVLNSAGEVLAVQERSGPAARPGFWKLPTGLVSQGEHVHEAVCREVLEETGVETEFLGVVGFRQAHGVALGGKDDLFFLCALRMKDPEDRRLAPQPSEIADACWMPLSEFGLMSHVRDETTVWGHLHSLCVRWASTEGHPLIETRDLPVGFRPGNNTVYSVAKL